MKWLSLFFESMRASTRLDSMAGKKRLGYAEQVIADHCDSALDSCESRESVESPGSAQPAFFTQVRAH